MGDVIQPDFLGLLRERKKSAGQEVVTEQQDQPQFDDDLLLDDEDVAVATTREQDEIDRILSDVTIVEAYNRWCSKGIVEGSGRRTEGIKVRCPNPAHPDQDPSAWINTDKNLWACGACGVRGGDIFDIAAWHFGYNVPGYKTDFYELKKKMAEALGYQTKKSPSGATYLERTVVETEDDPPQDDDTPSESEKSQPEVEGPSLIDKFRGQMGLGSSTKVVEPQGQNARAESPESPEPSNQSQETTESNVISIVPREGDEDFEPVTPSLDWPELMVDGTFLNTWMNESKADDLPEEYYFWLGLTGVGLAVGNTLALADNPPVKGNIFVVLYGSTGVGKSRSINSLLSVLRRAFPSQRPSEGVYHVPSPGSAEALIDSFSYFEEGEDEEREPLPVTGLIRFDELSTLMGRADRQGSAMKPTLMEFYDSYNPVTHKTRGHGEVTAYEHFASCLTTTQPKAIRELLTQTDADAGFVNRWIFATGTPKELIAFGRPSIDYNQCVPLLQGINKWASNLHSKSGPLWRTTTTGRAWTPVDMDPDALELWTEFFHDEMVPNKLNEGNALLSRSDLTMKKLIALLAFDRQHDSVQLIDVEHAIKVWAYLESAYRSLSREIGTGVFEDCRRFLGDSIKEHQRRTKKKASALDLLRLSDGRYNSALIRNVLETMVSLGEIEEVIVEKKNGKKVPVYAYVEE